MKRFLYLLILPLLTLGACEDAGEESDSVINIDIQTSQFENNGGDNKITFTATTAWSAQVTTTRNVENWCSVSPTSGEAGEVTLTVTTQPNHMPRERSASISIVAGGIEKSITVTQAAALHPANNMVWYTSTDGFVYYNPGSFGVAILSSTYENGTGVIIFDGDVTAVGENAFYQCSTLLEITLPNSITSIGKKSFSECTSLRKVNIGNRVKTIEDSAFEYCSNLTSITIPDSVTKIGDAAFYQCENIKFFYGKFATSDNKALIVDGVLKAFAMGFGATSYTIPDNVIEIGGYAFGDCSNLTSITIPDSVTVIGEYAFMGCLKLQNITIPESVTTIKRGAFLGCRQFTNIYIPSGVTNIADGIFAYCNKLKNVNIPDGVTEIGGMSFYQCSSLESITIPDSVTKIVRWAFFQCSNLTSATIGKSVTEIEDWAFNDCSSLKSIYCKPTTPPIAIDAYYYDIDDWYALSGHASDRKIYVPSESLEAYKAAEKWSDYAEAIVGYDF